MFEDIPFSSLDNSILFNSENIRGQDGFDDFSEEYPEFRNDVLFQMDGISRFLLPRPFPDHEVQFMIYMQSFTYSITGSRYYTERRNYASYLLMFTYGGKGALRYNGKTYSLQRGDLCIIDCRKEHYYCTDGDSWEHSDLHIQGAFLDVLFEEYDIVHHPYLHFDSVSTYQLALEKALRIQVGNHLHWAVKASNAFENLAMLVCSQIKSGEQKKIPERIAALRLHIENHFKENMTLDEMASFCYTSKYHLCREFKRCFGFTPKEYLNRVRINQASVLLSSTQFACYRIGLLCGFDSEANFIRQFKKQFGYTPGQFRDRYTAGQ